MPPGAATPGSQVRFNADDSLMLVLANRQQITFQCVTPFR
jgi:hypothetical protein